MKIPNKFAGICAVLSLAVMLGASSCSSVDPDYAQWGSAGVVGDARPDSVTPVGGAWDEPFETAAPEPTPRKDSESVAYVAMSPVRTVTYEPAMDEAPLSTEPESAVASSNREPVESGEKRSGFLGLFAGRKKAKTESPTYEPYSGPVPSTDVTRAKPVSEPKAARSSAPARTKASTTKAGKPSPSVASANTKSAPKKTGSGGQTKSHQVASTSSRSTSRHSHSSKTAAKKNPGDFINWLHQSR